MKEKSTGNLMSKEEEKYLELDSKDFPTERYSAIAELGKGSTGVVYLARDNLLKKEVSLKVLLDLTGEQLISFQDEAKATAKLEHPNIVKVLDFGASQSGRPYMVMNYVSGESLQKYLSENETMDETIACQAFAKLANALSYAHSQRVFHRDIKPSNILLFEVDEELEPCLIDFGVAKIKESTGMSLTIQNRTLAGTPEYMSPDPLRGESYDKQSEIYSLGCLFYEVLAGVPPFSGETAMEVLSMHSNQEPKSLLELKPYLGKDLAFTVHKCLEKNKEDRFASMDELKEALIECKQGLAEKEFESTEEHEPIKKLKRHYVWMLPLVALLAGFSFISLIEFPEPMDTQAAKNKKSQIPKLDNTRLFLSPFALVDESDTYLDQHILAEEFKRQKSRDHFTVRLADLTGDKLKPLDGSYKFMCFFESCKLDRGTFNHLAKIKRLQIIRLLSCNFDLKDFELLNKCPDLTSVTYATTDFKNLDKAIVYLAELKKLKSLSVRCRYTEESLSHDSLKALEKLKALDELKLIIGHVDKRTFESIAKLPHLKTLSLSECSELKECIPYMLKIKALTRFTLSSQHLEKDDLLELATIGSIRSLQFDNCTFAKSVSIKDLAGLRALHSLDLSTCKGDISYRGMASQFKHLKNLFVYSLTKELKEEVKSMHLDLLKVRDQVSLTDRVFFENARPNMKIEQVEL